MEQQQSSSSRCGDDVKSVCLLCLDKDFGPSQQNPGETTASSLKSLLRYLQVDDVSKGPDLGGGSSTSWRGNWVEEVLLSSAVCQECASLAALFGELYEDYEKLLQCMNQCVQRLECKLRNNFTPDKIPTLGHGDDRLDKYTFAAKILKQCSLKLKLKPYEPLPGVREDQLHHARENHVQNEQMDAVEDPNSNKLVVHDIHEGSGDGDNITDATPAAQEHQPSLSTKGSTPLLRSRKCVYCGISLRGPKSVEIKHLISFHTVQHYPDQFLGFTQTDIDKVIQDICRTGEGEGSNGNEANPWQCPFCQYSGKESDNKFHLIQQHMPVLKSRLEPRPQMESPVVEDEHHSDQDFLEEEEFQTDFEDDQSDDFHDDDQADDDPQEGQLNDDQDNMELPGGSEMKDETPDLEALSHFCGYCSVPLIGPLSNLKRHMMCVHTIAYFAKQRIFFGLADDDELDRLLLTICKESLVDDLEKQDTFGCPFCRESVKGDKKFHLLDQHMSVVQERLQNIARVPKNSNSADPLPLTQPHAVAPTGVPAPAADVQVLPTRITKVMRQRQINIAEFHRKRAYYRDNNVEPPYSYAFLIRQAIKESPGKELTSNEINQWVRRNFRFYKNRNEQSTRQCIGSVLSTRECFFRVDDAWRVKDKELLKPRASLSRKTCNNAGSTPLMMQSVNVKTEILEQQHQEGDLALPSRSSGSEEIPLTHQRSHFVNNIQNDKGDGGNVRNHQTEALRLLHGVKSKGQCLYCPFNGVRVDWHMTCVHSTRHIPQLAQRGTSQSDVNEVVRNICKESIVFPPTKQNNYYHCSLCGEFRTISTKLHLLREHLDTVLSRLEAASRDKGSTSNCGDSLMSSSTQHLNEQQRQWSTETGQFSPNVNNEFSRRVEIISEFHNNREYFKTHDVRPPYTYVFLIGQAITESSLKQLYFSEIISWIQSNFCYYRHLERLLPNLGNVLTSSTCFVRECVGGSDGVWRMDEEEFYKTKWLAQPAAAVKRRRTESQGTSCSNALESKMMEFPPVPPVEHHHAQLSPNVNNEFSRRVEIISEFQSNRHYFKTYNVKPPYSYAFLIGQAITEAPQKQLSSSEIISWVQANFCYYRSLERLAPNVRNVLTVSTCFVREYEGGRDGWVWRMDEEEFYYKTKWLARPAAAAVKRRRTEPQGTSCSNALEESNMMEFPAPPVEHQNALNLNSTQNYEHFQFTASDTATGSSGGDVFPTNFGFGRWTNV